MPKPTSQQIIQEQLNEVLRLLRLLFSLTVSQGGQEHMDLKAIQAKLEDTRTKVAALTEVDKSAVELLMGVKSTISDLKAQLADALANNDPAGLQKAFDTVDAIETGIDENTQSLAAAVAAGTT